jgi:chromosome partition protein MukE
VDRAGGIVSGAYVLLEDAIGVEVFPEVDLALRRGRHIDRDDTDWYAFLVDASGVLEPFYRRYGCDLVHKTDGYFYLLPTDDRLGRRHLSPSEMLVGQALALLWLDPATVEHGGCVTREQVLAQLAGIMGADSLVRAMNPTRRRRDERVEQENVRTKVGEAIRRLGSLGFVELADEARLKLRPALMRFADPVRGAVAPEKALAQLVAEGEIALVGDDDSGLDAEDDSNEGEAEGSGQES